MAQFSLVVTCRLQVTLEIKLVLERLIVFLL